MKKILSVALVVVLLAGMAVTGTMAYLQDSDSDVNVMTLGNVSIRQDEEQRVDPSKNGTLTDADIEDFEQAKPLLPYVDENLNNAMRDDYEEITFPNGKTHKLFIGDNAIDKLVSVTNTGKTDAYVRTIVALEAPTDKIDLSFNSTDWTMDKTASSHSIEVDGVKYDLFVCVYNNVLKPDETTPYSLLQIALGYEATNEDSAAYGDTYDVLVLSQAVQAEGFADAKTALNTAFGVVDATTAAEWFGGDEFKAPTVVSTAAELKAALAKGGSVVLGNDITAEEKTSLEIPEGKTVVLNLNGHTLTNAVSGNPALVNNGTLTIDGDGAIVNGISDTAKSHTVRNYGTLTINGGNIGTFATSGAAVVNDGNTVINGGTFASRQESNSQYGQGPAAYALINNSGTMTINDATINGPTHGLFGAYAGELIVNGGNYTLVGNNGMGCYVVYATGDGTKVTLNGGTINTNEPRHGRVFFVYSGDKNYFNADAVKTGKIVVGDATIYLNGVEQNYSL